MIILPSADTAKHVQIAFKALVKYNTGKHSDVLLYLTWLFSIYSSTIGPSEYRLRAVPLDVMFIAENCYYYHCRFTHVRSFVCVQAARCGCTSLCVSVRFPGCVDMFGQHFHAIKNGQRGPAVVTCTRDILIAYKCQILVSHKIKWRNGISLCCGKKARTKTKEMLKKAMLRAPRAIIVPYWEWFIS